ncbi:MAG: peptidoglycan-binding protein [Clostridium sp.]|nr:peptidoglycan-binding protein [Clostridium sp.]MCM1547705.1 peptidoglycan-binding protein [Ruminococcus sp.]
MYSDDSRHEHIKEIQRLLYAISFGNNNVSIIFPDGIYGDETKESVRSFQREYGLSADGNVSPETWDAIVRVHRSLYPTIIRPDVFKEKMVLMPGNSGDAVYFIQLMLNCIGRKYGNIPILKLTGIYDADTQNALNVFKEISGHEVRSEGVDAHFLNAITSAFNKCV